MDFSIKPLNVEPWAVALAIARSPALMRAGVTAGAIQLLAYVKPYPAATKHPSRASVYGEAFVSAKQRYWFFGALAAGRITVPYRRGAGNSQRLGRSWAVETRSSTLAVVGTQVTYARFVKDESLQSPYLAALGWSTIQSDAQRAKPKVQEALRIAISKALSLRD